MRLYEWEAKLLLRAHGIAVPTAVRARTAEEAARAAAELAGPVAIKAQVLSGGRMKAGGIHFAASPDEARAAAACMLGRDLLGSRVEEVLVEARAPSGCREMFAAVTYDAAEKAPVVLLSAEGGVDVEQAARAAPAKVARHVVEMTRPFTAYKAREVASAAGLSGPELAAAGDLVQRLYELFYRYDATIVEINPLVWLDGKRFIALDAHIELDDEALYRHRELDVQWGIRLRPGLTRQPTSFEEAAARIDAGDHRGVAGRVVEFDGDLGLLIGGGGASLTTFDAVLAVGGRPANYCEMGGNPSVRKIRDLTRLILSKPGVRRLAVITNVLSNSRVDLVARGVIKGIVELGLDPREVVVVFRVPGAWEEEGVKILRRYSIPFGDRTVSLDEAARLGVERGQEDSGHPGG